MTQNRARRMTLAFEHLEDRWNPAPFTVDNGSWDPAAQSALPNHGSLPWCIAQANASPGVDDIFFDYTPGGLVPAGVQIGGEVDEPGPGGNAGNAGNAGGSSGVTLTSTATLSVTDSVRIWGGGGGQYIILTGITPFKFTTGDSEIHGMAFDKCKPDVNAVEKKGGAIQVKGGKVTTFNTRFTNNTANNGGAVFVDVFGTLVLDGDQAAPPDTTNYGEQLPVNGKSRTLFQKNTSNTDGGAIESDGTVILKRVSFYQNTAGSKGGGINNNSVTASIAVPVAPPAANGELQQQSAFTDVTFRQNVANQQGGAVSVKGGTVDLIGVAVQANSVGFDGGGFCVLNGTVNVKDSTVTGNKAVKGAAIYLLGANNDAPTVDLKNVTFGGSIVLPGGTAAIDVSTGGTRDTHGCFLNGDVILCTIAAGQALLGTFNPDPNDPDTP